MFRYTNLRKRVFLAAMTLAVVGGLFRGAFGEGSDKDLIKVQVNRPGGKISPTMFGIFFEDINFAADGGLYPERVKNRSFEFTEPLSAWKKLEGQGAEGELDIRSDGALNDSNPHTSGYTLINPVLAMERLTKGIEA
jgi:alpha-L-arabinofuranosidase